MSRLLPVIFSLALISCVSHQPSQSSNVRFDLESGTFVNSDKNSTAGTARQSRGIHYTFNGVIYPDENSAVESAPMPVISPKAKAAPSSSYSSSRCHYVKGYYRKNGSWVKGYTRCR